MRNRWRELLWLCLALAAGGLLAVMQVGGLPSISPQVTRTPTATPFPTFPFLGVPYPTEMPTISIVDLHITATALSQQDAIRYVTATQLALTATSTPFPTDVPLRSESELLALRDEYLNTLEDALGFSYPTLPAIADEYIGAIRRYEENENLGAYPVDFGTSFDIDRIEQDNNSYVALVTRSGRGISSTSRLQIFQQGDPVNLILDSRVSHPGVTRISLGRGSNYRQYRFGGFGDINQNQLVDLVAHISGGPYSASTFLILEIGHDASITDITPGREVSQPVTFVNLDNDAVLEIANTDCTPFPPSFYENCRTIYDFNDGVRRYYDWTDGGYIDISASLDEAIFFPDIGIGWMYVETTPGCFIPNRLVYRMLMSYHIRGQLAEAWERLQLFIESNPCSYDTLERYGMDTMTLEDWVQALLGQSQPLATD
ncbi:MAG: hypothetical protein SF123_25615 [Chloroflexota bacterium]|nr:hypothetical protein [Chloroflexota bacterium]